MPATMSERRASNPPCEPWCTKEHASGELSTAGGLLCVHTVFDSDGARIDVQRVKYVPLDGGPIQTESPTVWLEGGDIGVLTPERAERLSEAIQEAAELVRRGGVGTALTRREARP